MLLAASGAKAVLLRHTTLRGNQGRLEIAAEGAADRRSAKNASAGMNQSREAHHSARPLHSPYGGMSCTEAVLGRSYV
jgi:hypothetical protein